MNPDSVQIRRAVAADAAAICRVRKASWLATYPSSEFGISAADILASIDFDSSAERAKWEYILTDPNNGDWVAESAGEIVGFMAAGLEAGQRRIFAMYLLPDFQRRGIGSQLMQTALDWLGAGSVRLGVFVLNTGAIEFYRRFGFELTGREFDPEVLQSGAQLREVEMLRDETNPTR